MKQIAEVAETGSTFEENAVLKALAVSRHLAGLILADDSGLEVNALGGAPGVLSARYAGDRADDADKIKKLLSELANTDPQGQRREARFRCVMAVARGGELLGTFTGCVEGAIAPVPRGETGFGYDPVFIPRDFAQTFAEMLSKKKNQLSHRARALESALPLIREALRDDSIRF